MIWDNSIDEFFEKLVIQESPKFTTFNAGMKMG